MARKSVKALLPIEIIASAMVLSLVSLSYASGVVNSERSVRPLVTQEIDETKLVVLYGNTRPEANAINDRGAVADDFQIEHMLLQLQRSPEQEQALVQFINQLHTPGSPNFHHWLTPQEFGQRFGLAQEDLVAITTWLQSNGFQVNVVYPNGMLIDFSGSAGQVRETFRTEIHNLEVRGARRIANMSDPQIPAALKPAVAGIVSLHNFMPHPMYKPRSNYTFASGGYAYYAVVPADLATIYNLNPLFSASTSGQGQTVVVIEDTNVYSTADWATFRSTFGLSGYSSGSFTQVQPAPPSGSNNCGNPGVNGDDVEAILDAEYASAAAPNAAILLASCSDTSSTFGGLIALQNLLNESSAPPAIVSISYGECEAYNGAAANSAYNSAYQQAVTEGVSVFVSSGDEGAASCDADMAKATHGIGVSAFASTPYNVAVGGTDFGDTYAGSNNTYWNSTNTCSYGSATSYIPEIPWNDSCASSLLASYEGSSATYGSTGFCNTSAGESFLTTASGSGGPSGCATGNTSTSGVVSGTCKGYAKPSWQSILGNPNDGVRDIPDVSLFAANGLWGHYYVFCFSDPSNGGVPCSGAPSGWAGAGGTSFASPIMAGIQALVNQKYGRQGNPNPTYYKLAANEYGASGNSSCNSTSGNAAAATCMFYDVTQGDMDVNCTGSHNCYLPSGTSGVLSTSNTSYAIAFGTTTGWDFATGIGTVNASNLVNNWSSGGGGGGTAPAVSLNPTSLSFASQPVGNASSAQAVTLTNTGNATLNISAIRLTGTNSGDFAQSNNCPATLSASSYCTIDVTFKPTATGARSAAVTISDNAAGSPQSVSLTGTGTAPAASLSPASVNFGAVRVGSSSSAHSVALTNSGTTALTISSISITGTNSGDFSETNSCPASLVASAHCTINVTFKPTARGTRQAKLVVADNASGSPQTTNLSGSGR